MHTITIFSDGRSWLTRHSDPEVKALFGTDVLPSSFMACADPAKVLAHIRRLNPDRDVTLRIAE